MKKKYFLKTSANLFLPFFLMFFAFNLHAQTVTLNAVLSGKVTPADVLTNGDISKVGYASGDKGYLKFDLTAIPVGAIIIEAKLKMVAIAPSIITSSSFTSTVNLKTTTLDGNTSL